MNTSKSNSTPQRRAHKTAAWLLLAALFGAGCDFFNPGPAPDAASPSDAGFGYGRPTLEVTINGVHFGPSDLNTGATASLVNGRSSTTGRITTSTFQLFGSSAASSANCSLSLQRYGDDILPISIGGYEVSPPATNFTRDGTVAPTGTQSVTVPQGSWQCSGSACNGGVFAITALDQDHVEGYLSGVFVNPFTNTPATVVCSFYAPWSSYLP